MRYPLYFLLFTFISCNSTKEVPKELLNEIEMSNVLIDVHLLESKINTLGKKGDTAFQIYDHFEKLILEKHGVDSLTYVNSLDYYMNNSAFMETVYTAIIDSLVVRQKNYRID
ncbi:MAG: DUF4296 domain-containing protein [Flammeovirgaceae bacterium]|jgi:hypothetical protein|nr:DUF4296 domain-containing protein [Flammeovirgaceae bacterium]